MPIAVGTPTALSSLSGLQYTGGPLAGTDLVWLDAYNGQWSGWTQAKLTDLGVAPPVVTSTNQSVTYNQQISLNPTVFTVTGSGVSQYEIIFDYSGSTADGSLTNNGVPIAVGTPTALSSLSGLQYTGGPLAGTDLVWLDAYNGQWSGWTQAKLTDLGVAPPVVTSTNQSVTYNQQISLNPTVFTVTGSGVSQYEIIFDYSGSTADGSLTNNGVPIAVGTPTALSSLSGLQYTGGPLAGTDLVWLDAYNGQWSGWTQAKLTDLGVAPPVVTSTDQSVTYNQQISLNPTVFTVTGSGVSQYEIIFDYSGSTADGSLTNNGVPIAVGTPTALSSLSGLQYTGGPLAGTDLVWLDAYNGQWSGWTQAKLTDLGVGQPPIATASGNNLVYMSSAAQTSLDFYGAQIDTVVGFDQGNGNPNYLMTRAGSSAPADPDQFDGKPGAPITIASSSTSLLAGIAHTNGIFLG